MTGTQTCAAVVLAGGRARRMAGADKLMARLADRTVLAHTLAAVADLPTVVVGPRRPDLPGVRWISEDPPGTGPVAAIAAAVAVLPPETGQVVVLAADQPGVVPATITRLRTALATTSPDASARPVGAVLCDADGRTQWLISVWDRAALAAALPPDPAGRAVRAVLGELPIVGVPAIGDEADDVDTPADLTAWRDRLGPPAGD